MYVKDLGDKQLVLIDTPGFDNDGVSDIDLLSDIVNALKAAYDSSAKLTGVIYMHNIAASRVGYKGRTNIRMLKSLTGEKSYSAVVIATTFWADMAANNEAAVRYEKELREEGSFYADIMAGGGWMPRYQNTQESGTHIINYLIIRKCPTTLKIQTEVKENEGIELGETSAGKVLLNQILEKQSRLQKELDQIAIDIKRAYETKDPGLASDIEKLAEVTKDLSAANSAQQKARRKFKGWIKSQDSRVADSAAESLGDQLGDAVGDDITKKCEIM